MKFTPQTKVIVLDTTYKPAGTGIIISYEPRNDFYKIKYTGNNSIKEEVIEIPAERLLVWQQKICNGSNMIH